MPQLSTKAILSAIAVFLLVAYIILLNLQIKWLKSDLREAKLAHQEYVLEQDRKANEQRAESLKTEQKQNKVTLDTALGYSAAIERQRKYYETHPVVKLVPGSVRKSAANDPGTVPTTTPSASNTHEASSQSEAGSSGESPVTEQDCASDAAQLLWLQDWLNKQGLSKLVR